MAEMMMIAGAVATVGGALAQGESQRQVHRYNAQIAENEAQQGQLAAQYAINQNTDRSNRLLSQQRAQIAKSGFDIGGSPLLLMEETARMASLENQMLQYQADLQSQNMRQAAVVSRKQGRNARVAGAMNAGTSLLNAGSQGVFGPQKDIFGGINSGTSNNL